jgi:hypothetical protein
MTRSRLRFAGRSCAMMTGAVIAIGACGGDENSDRYELVPFLTLGVPDGVADDRALPEVFGVPRAVVELEDGSIWILDVAMSRIVVVHPERSPRASVIELRRGSGPGEFRVPVDLVASPAGGVGVLDYELRRITWFDSAGNARENLAIPVPGPLRAATVPEGVWISTAVIANSDRSPAVLVSGAGAALDSLPSLAGEDRRFGTGLVISAGPDGALRMASARPGLWNEWKGGELTVHGALLVDRLDPPTVTQHSWGVELGRASASIVAFGLLSDGRAIVQYRTVSAAQDGEPEFRTMVVSPDGRHGEVEGFAGFLLAVSRTDRVYSLVSDPYPTVVVQELVRR